MIGMNVGEQDVVDLRRPHSQRRQAPQVGLMPMVQHRHCQPGLVVADARVDQDDLAVVMNQP